MKIRTEFAILLLLVSFVLSGVIYGGFEVQKQNIVDQEKQEAEDTAEIIASEISQIIEQKKESISVQASQMNLSLFGTNSQAANLDHFLKLSGFSGVSVIDKDGKVVGIRGVDESIRMEVMGDNFSNRDYFQKSISGDVYVSTKGMAERGDNILVISSPIRKGGEVVGVLAGSFRLGDSSVFKPLEPFTNSGQSFTVTKSGSELFSRGKDFESGISGSSKVNTTGWVVKVSKDRSQVTAATQNIVLFQASAVAAVLLTIIIFGVWEYKTNLSKIEKLLKGFKSIERGNYNYRMVLTGSDEWNEIGEEFNEVVESLERREQELIEERDRFAALYENVPDPVVSVTFEENEPIIESVNEEFENTFGYEEKQIVGMSVDELIVPPEYEEQADDLNEEITQGNRLKKEVRRKTRDGIRDFLLQVVPYKVGEETTEGYAVYTNITERKQRQRRLQVLNRVLRHDLRNSMSVIMGNCEILEEQIEEDSSRDRISDIMERAGALMQMSERARRLEQTLNRDVDTTADIDLVQIVDVQIEKVEEEYPDAVVTSDLPSKMVVHAEDILDYAIENIIENAIEHNDSQPPEVHISIEEGVDEETAVIEVADNGPGIPEHEVKILTGEEDITQTRHGSGLGLWMVNWIVTQSGGSLEFKDNKPKGSIVTIKLTKAEIPMEADKHETGEIMRIEDSTTENESGKDGTQEADD